jgi:uncharacterized protein YprB with RNaseH-like and TPR domain
MNLADRLRAVVNPTGSAPAGSASPSAPPPPACPAAPRTGPSRFAGLEPALGGEWRDGPQGRSFVVARRYGPDARCGHSTIGELSARLAGVTEAAALVSAPSARPPFLFFDLETTGLSGGAGTYAFMVGCGWFDSAAGFVTEQHLLVDYASERNMLQTVAAELARSGALVSFNGKSFDVPVLETRYAYNRLASPCTDLPHLDVLHPARRFWENGESCSLTALERQVLGASRTGDVPGFEIPGRYFQFIRSGDPGPLAPVFEHNRRDLLSLAGLTARLLHLIRSGPQETRHAREALALGRVYARGGMESRAAEAFEHALGLCDSGQSAARRGEATGVAVEVEALRSLAIAARRARHYEAAAVRWRQVLDVPGCPRQILTEASEALAIHHEHRARDLATARMFALRTLEMRTLEAKSLARESRGTAWGDAVRHRLARIERKMVSELPLFPS